MSCGKPHETPCSQVLAEVWLLLDSECEESRRNKLRRHLEECGSCLEQYDIEEKLKLLLARKCGGDHASQRFKEQLRATIMRSVVEQVTPTQREVLASPEGVRPPPGSDNELA